MLPLLHSTRRATFMCRLVLPMAVHASSTVTVPVKVFGPVDVKSGIDGDTTFDLKDTRGAAVLIWITDLGEARVAQINEVRVSA